MKYYNPLTQKTGNMTDSKLSILQVKENNDKVFINFLGRKASPKTKHVIGVVMTVKFVFENPPQKGMQSKEENIDTRAYRYILELDEDENIVGGEWTENKHPIFIWQPADDEKPMGYGDDQVESFNGTVEELKKITQVASRASKNRSVLGAIVRYFIEQAK